MTNGRAMRRREFLEKISWGTAVAWAAASCRSPGNPSVAPPVVVDSHIHFYDPERPGGVPWPPPGDTQLYRRVLPSEYLSKAEPLGIGGAVLVEASPRPEDNDWMLDLAASHPFILGVVGNLDLTASDFRGRLDRLVGHPKFCGLRISGDQLNRHIDDADYLGRMQQLEKAGVVLDILGGSSMLISVGRLAKLFPGLRLVVDHMANPPIDGLPAPLLWRQNMQIAATQPNVFCKLSGLVENVPSNRPDLRRKPANFYPVVDSLWELFGEDRLVFGSNWPVSEKFASLAHVVALADAVIASRGARAGEKVFYENSRRLYGWTVPERWIGGTLKPSGSSAKFSGESADSTFPGKSLRKTRGHGTESEKLDSNAATLQVQGRLKS